MIGGFEEDAWDVAVKEFSDLLGEPEYASETKVRFRI